MREQTYFQVINRGGSAGKVSWMKKKTMLSSSSDPPNHLESEIICLYVAL